MNHSAVSLLQQKLDLYTQQSPLGVIEWNHDFEVVDWNPAAERIFGYSREQALGRHASFIIPETHHAQVDAVWQALMEQKGGSRSTNSNITSSGRTIECEWYNKPLVNTSGKVVGAVSLVQDVTEKLRAEEALQQSELTLRERHTSLIAIHNIADRVYRSLDMQTVADEAVAAMMEYSQSPSVAFYVVNEEAACFDLLSSQGFSQDTQLVGQHMPLQGSLSGVTVERQEVVCTEDIAHDQRIYDASRKLLAKQGYHSAISIPLLFQARVLGVMNLVFRTLHQVNDAERETLLSIGKTIGLALANAMHVAQLEREMVDRMQAQQTALESEQRLKRQQSALAALSNQQSLARADFDLTLRMATEITAQTLDVERVSVWLYEDDRARIHCVSQYELSRQQHSAGMTLYAKDYPLYFQALEDDRIIVADEACSYPATQEFEKTYLKPLGITSMLDAPVRQQGEVNGVLCIEHVGPLRSWAIDEQNFAGSVADLISLAMELWEHKRTTDELRSYQEHLEERVAERTADLHALNHVLESFSYSVSHDLRAPLRAINGFSQVLLEDYAPMLDETGRDYLQRVQANAVRMAELIDALLQLSRMVRSEMQRSKVDLSKMVGDVIAELKQTEPQRNLILKVAAGIEVQADATMLRIVFENLLGNAWKYTRQNPEPHIEFGMQRDHERPVYFVRDNGVGFDMQFADKLFGAFQRLHRQDEFEGTGIGLATVQRIVHRHGGRIWAEAEAGKGATFYFTLGKPGP